MTPESGWYPDPTGMAQYRFWNGETWTTATASPASPTAPQPAPALQQSAFAPNGYGQSGSAYGSGSVLPNDGYFGGAQGASTFFGPAGLHAKPRRSKSFYGVIAGIAAAAVAVAVVIPFTVGGSAASNKPGAIRVPSTFNGSPRLSSSQIDQATSAFKKRWPLDTKVVVGAYGDDINHPDAVAIAGNINLSPAGIKDTEAEMQRAMSADGSTTFIAQDPGPYGGLLRCATAPASAGVQAAVCLSVDSNAVGFFFVREGGDSGIQHAIQLRFAVETPPAT